MNKKFIAATVFSVYFATSLTQTAAYAKVKDIVISDGDITLDGIVEKALGETNVSAVVTDYGTEWTDESVWKDNVHSQDKIRYYGETAIDSDERYQLEFALTDSGLYTAYIGHGVLAQPDVRHFLYINKTDNDAALAELVEALGAESADLTANVLKNRKSELGLFEEIYSLADIDASAAVMYSTLKGTESILAQDAVCHAYRAMVISMLNLDSDGNTVKNLSDYTDYLYLDGEQVAEFISDEILKNITENLRLKSFLSESEFLDELTRQTILENIKNNDGIGIIKKLLNTFGGSYIDIGTVKITDSLSSAVAEKRVFSDIDALSKFVKEYREPQKSDNSGSGSSGSKNNSSGSNRGNSYSGSEAIGNPSGQPLQEINAFSDIDDVPWAQEAIRRLYGRGVISGKQNGIFAPHDYVTREEFAKMISLAFRINIVGSGTPFSDVSENDWSYPYIVTAYSSGITSGMSDTYFGKHYDIKRQDVCVMLARALDAADMTLPDNGGNTVFADADEVSGYAKDAVTLMARAGVVSGDESGSFNPNEGATRAQTAKMIYSCINMMKSVGRSSQ